MQEYDERYFKLRELKALYIKKDYLSLIEKSEYFLKNYPNNVDALNFLGAANKLLGRAMEAVNAFTTVCKLDPHNANNFINLGVTLQDFGENEEAIKNYKIAIKLDPQNFSAYFNIANAYKEKGLYARAIKEYEKSLRINPRYPEALNNLGIALKEKRKLLEAENLFKKAIAINPKYAAAYNNMGNVLKDQGKLDHAVQALKKAIELDNRYAEAYNNYGLVLKRQNSLDQAIQAYDAALKIKPDYAEAYNNKGLALKKIKRHDEAEECYLKALALKKEYAEAQRNLADILNIKNRKQEALIAYEQALHIRPEYELAKTEKLFIHSQLCQWTDIEKEKENITKLGFRGEMLPLFSLLALDDNPGRQLRRAKEYARVSLAEKTVRPEKYISKKSQKIKIGYFSSDFREHPVGYLIARIIEQHDREEFDVFGFDLSGGDGSEMHKRFQNAFDKLIDISKLTDSCAINLVCDEKIDIAINLNGYTDGARNEIFAQRIAPVQINYLGYPGTMGLKSMDYIISDKTVVPVDNQKYFSEAQIYMPFTYMPTDNTREISTKEIAKSEFSLPDDSFVICCFNNSYKINRKDFRIWLRCMQKVENSVLWLRKPHDICLSNLTLMAEEFEVEASRLIVAERVPMNLHLARHKLADVFVDTSTFNAHTTAVDALWAGLPVITRPGRSFASRVASSLLLSLELPELIANNDLEYEALLLNLAQNRERIKNIKVKLRENILQKPLFMSDQYTKYLEYGYRVAHANFHKGKSPHTILVPPC